MRGREPAGRLVNRRLGRRQGNLFGAWKDSHQRRKVCMGKLFSGALSFISYTVLEGFTEARRWISRLLRGYFFLLPWYQEGVLKIG
jgi:hypothetical protein